jgi:hypothetical protein
MNMDGKDLMLINHYRLVCLLRWGDLRGHLNAEKQHYGNRK